MPPSPINQSTDAIRQPKDEAVNIENKIQTALPRVWGEDEI